MEFKKTELLRDEPTISDAFGTHQRIAKLLKQEVLDSESGRSIALVGDWGSGKSTVIEILREELEKAQEEPTHVFVYDAWAHQGDSLRRAFLDDFIMSLKKYLTKEQYTDAVERIWNRTETTKTTREPVLRNHAKLMLLSLALVPIGMTFFQLPSDGASMPWTELLKWYNLLALVLMTAPVLLVLFFSLINWKCPLGIRQFFFNDSCKDPNFSVLSFFVEKTQGEVERKEIKSPADSIGTFREVFCKIVDHAYSRNNNLRIVIIIDNIDRIPPDHAREFWSTMQTFFSDGGGLRQAQSMKYWLIAPFSVEALSFIFGGSALGASTTATRDAANSGVKHDGNPASPPNDAKMRAKAYIDKTFGLAFHVPPPILSNWRSYLLHCLKEAFVKHNPEELEAVRDVYDFGRVATSSITPRDIKLFVNSLVALYRQRGDEIPLPMMASYLLHREDIDGMDIHDDLAGSRERRAVGAAYWRTNMAALHFGVPLQEGQQLLLYEPIVKALREGTDDDLRKLEIQPGFSHVLRKAVLGELGTSQANDGVALAKLAKKLGALEYMEMPEAIRIWEDIGNSLKSVSDWSGLQLSPADGITIVIEHIQKPEKERICRAVALSLTNAQPSEIEEKKRNLSEFAKNWALTAKAVLDSSDPADSLKITIPHEPKFTVEIVKQLSVLDVEPAHSSAFEVEASSSELSKVMAADIRAGVIITSPEQFAEYVSHTMQLQLQWQEIATAITERMKVTDLNEDEVRSHLALLLSAYGYRLFPEALNLLKDLSRKGHLSHLLNRHRKNQDVCATIVTAIMLANPVMDRPNQVDESQQGDAILNQIINAAETDDSFVNIVAKIVQRSGMTDILYETGAQNPAISRFAASVIGVIAKSDHEINVTPETITQHWAYIEQNADLVPAGEFLNGLKNKKDFLSYLTEQPFNINHAGLCRASIKVAGSDDAIFWDYLKQGITEITSDDWLKTLTEQQGPYFELICLARELNNLGHDIQLQVQAKDAILNYVRGFYKGKQAATDEMHERLRSLIGLLQHGYRTYLCQDFDDDILSLSDVGQMVRLVEVAGDEMSLDKVQDPDKIVRRIFSPLMTKPTNHTVNWIRKIVEHKNASFWSLSSEAKDELAIRMQSLLEENESLEQTTRSSLNELADYFGIDLPAPTSEQPESGE